MPLPQVNDRLKEIPAQALRTLFATVGQLLLVADRFRARAAEQLSGSDESTATRPADQAPTEAPPVTPPAPPPAPRRAPAQDAESARWRSLDKTGNVRLLDGNEEEQDAEDPGTSVTPAGTEPSSSAPAFSEPVTRAAPDPVPAPAEYTPTEPVPSVPTPAEPQPAVPQPADPAVSEPADLAVPEPAVPQPAVPDPADLAVPQPADPAVPDPADLAVPQPADPAVPEPADLAPVEAPAESAPADLTTAEPVAAALPVPNYDQLTVPSLRARLRVLDADGVQVLLDYEKAHEGRPAVITMFERRLTKLREGS